MKKLMTMIAAVGMAFGLFADVVPSITDNAVNFSGFTNMNPWDLTDKDGKADALWTWSDTAPATDEAKIEDGELVLKTGAKILARKFAGSAVTVNDELGLFANVKLDFQNQGIDVDSIPTATDLNGAKLALFLLDTSDVEGAKVSGTNLFAIAGYGSTRALYQLSAVVDDSFLAKEHTFTIKFYNKALSDSNRAGFMIYMDCENSGAGKGEALSASYRYDLDGDAFDLTARTSCKDGNYLDLTVNPSLMNWYNQQMLLVSLVQNADQTFAGVEFKGNASIASIELTDDKSKFAFIPGDSKAIGVNDSGLATLLTAANFTFNPAAGASFANGVITVFDDATQITVTPTFSSDKEVHKITIGSKEGTDSLTFTIDDGTTLTVTEAAAAAYVTVDGGDPKPVASLEDAIDAVNDATTAGTLKLANSVTIDDDLLEDAEMSFNGTDVTLDLNGKIITGCADARSDTVIYNAGKLTIVDTSDAKTGKIVPDALNDYAVLNESGATLAIEAGIFDGKVVENGTESITATAGSFLNTAMTADQVKAFIDEATYKVDGEIVEGYWTVVELPKTITVTIGAATQNAKIESVLSNDVPVVYVAGDYVIPADESLTVTYAPNTGYEFKDGQAVWTLDTDGEASECPTATAITYTISYMCDDGVTPFTQFKQVATIPYSYTVAEVVTLPGADAIDEALGGTWEAWTNANGVAVTDTTGLMADLTVFAQIKQQGSPGADVVKNSVEGADDITDPDQKAALEVNATALSTTLGGPDKVAEWAANVYTSEKIPAEKLAKTSAEVIALAVANDLPITENEPTFTVAEGEVTTGVAAFVFTLEDGEDPVAIEKMTAKVKAMVKYTGDLTDDFDAATEDEVAVGLNEGGAITAELKKQDDVNAGFMKVEPNQPTK